MGKKNKKIKTKKTKKTKKKQERVKYKKLIRQNTFKARDEKIEIKKIKKQPTEKKVYNVKDYVVYPMHGLWKWKKLFSCVNCS